MPVKLVVFDLDGTVVDHEGKPTSSTLEKIRRLIDEGIPVASISGRSISKSQYPFEQHTDFADELYVGSYNGAVALDRDRDGVRRPLHEERMPEDAFRAVIEELGQAGINYIYCHLKLGDRGLESEDYMTLRRDKTIDDMTLQTATQFVIDPDLTAKISDGAFGAPPKILICPGEAARATTCWRRRRRQRRPSWWERPAAPAATMPGRGSWPDLLEASHPGSDSDGRRRAIMASPQKCSKIIL